MEGVDKDGFSGLNISGSARLDAGCSRRLVTDLLRPSLLGAMAERSRSCQGRINESRAYIAAIWSICSN